MKIAFNKMKSVLFGYCLFIFAHPLYANDALPTGYIHMGVGVGMDWLESSDIDSLFDDSFEITELGFPISLNIRGGYSNIVQLEYRSRLTGGDHELSRPVGFSQGSFQFETIDMEYEYEERYIKFNPFYKGYKKNEGAIFLVVGFGDVEFKDDLGDGWEGDSTIFGLEYSILHKYITVNYGFKYIDVDFDSGTIPVLTGRSYSATQYLLDVSIAFGFGK